MNWKSFLSRIVLISIAFPVLGASILLVPQLHHLAFNVVVVSATLIGALEVMVMFRARKIPTSGVLAPALAAVLPVMTWLEIAGILPAFLHGIALPAAIGIILVRSALFTPGRSLQGILAFTASSTFIIVYPGFLLSYVVRLSSLPDSSVSILLFLCLVFGNDMAAYFAGSMWGGSTRLHLPISPQKSVVGFAAGLIGSFIIIGFFLLAVPDFMRFGVLGNILLGLLVGVAVILGDLIESGLKRSARVKDSGIAIPGRGGMLDSIDSILFSAPLFYYFFAVISR